MTPEARNRRRCRTPVLVITAIAWVATLAVHAIAMGSEHSMSHMSQMSHTGHVSSMAPMAGTAHVPGAIGSMPATMTSDPMTSVDMHEASTGSVRMFLTEWPFMLTAMMAPLLIPVLRHAHARSLPGRRWRTLTLLVVAYAAAWSVGGLILLAGMVALWAATPSNTVAIALAILATALWQVSPPKQRCLNRRQAHPPLAAFGRAADLDALRLGGTHALWCLGSCWALMLLPHLFDQWHLAVLAIVTLWIWAEAFEPSERPTWRPHVPTRAALILSAALLPPISPAHDGLPGS